ncbi:flagellar biosynthetic protein FliR [Salmonella enterica subsp. enterica]|nr:flagellar biosynthetic protein FliR [Salmonella enterica subsp. enterica]
MDAQPAAGLRTHSVQQFTLYHRINRTMIPQDASEQWLYWLHLFLAFAARTGADFSSAHSPMSALFPKRVKLGLGIMITLVIAPSLPANDTPLFCAALWLAMQQILIRYCAGLPCNSPLRRCVPRGEFIGLQMGLSFATFVDPGSRDMPVLARIGYARHATVSLTFNGKDCGFISLLVDTFHTFCPSVVTR